MSFPHFNADSQQRVEPREGRTNFEALKEDLALIGLPRTQTKSLPSVRSFIPMHSQHLFDGKQEKGSNKSALSLFGNRIFIRNGTKPLNLLSSY